jgi:hypothetical protein
MTHTYVFDGAYTAGATVRDLSGSWNGTVNGTLAFSSDGPRAGAGSLLFDGASTFVSLGNRTFGAPVSMVLWAKPMLNSSLTWQRLFDFGAGLAVDNLLLSARGPYGAASLSVYNSATPGDRFSTYTAANDTWTHFAMTVDAAGFVALYANGSRVFSTTTNAARTVPRPNMYLGKSNWGDPLYAGALATFHIAEGYVLTDKDVQNHYSNAGCPTPACPYVYYSFGVNCPNNDLGAPTAGVSSVCACAALCGNATYYRTCVGFAYAASTSQCWLKNSTATAVSTAYVGGATPVCFSVTQTCTTPAPVANITAQSTLYPEATIHFSAAQFFSGAFPANSVCTAATSNSCWDPITGAPYYMNFSLAAPVAVSAVTIHAANDGAHNLAGFTLTCYDAGGVALYAQTYAAVVAAAPQNYTFGSGGTVCYSMAFWQPTTNAASNQPWLFGMSVTGCTVASAAARRRALLQALPPPGARRRLEQLAEQAAPPPLPLQSLPPALPPALSGMTCLSLTLERNASGMLTPVAPADASGVRSWYALLPAGDYVLQAGLRNGTLALVAPPSTLPFTLLAPPSALPPSLEGAVWVAAALAVPYDAATYTDATLTGMAAAAVGAVSAWAAPLGATGVALALDTANATLVLDMQLLYTTSGRRLAQALGAADLAALVASMEAAFRGEFLPGSATAVPGARGVLSLRLANAATLAAAVADAAPRMQAAALAALPAGMSATLADTHLGMRAVLTSGVLPSVDTAASLDVMTATVGALLSGETAAALAAVAPGAQFVAAEEMCFTPAGGQQVCAFSLPEFTVAVAQLLLAATAAQAQPDAVTLGVLDDLAAILNSGALAAQDGSAVDLNAMRLQLLNVTAAIMMADASAGSSSLGAGPLSVAVLDTVAALLNISSGSAPSGWVLPTAAVASRSLELLASVAAAATAAGSGAALADCSAALLSAGTGVSRGDVANVLDILGAVTDGGGAEQSVAAALALLSGSASGSYARWAAPEAGVTRDCFAQLAAIAPPAAETSASAVAALAAVANVLLASDARFAQRGDVGDALAVLGAVANASAAVTTGVAQLTVASLALIADPAALRAGAGSVFWADGAMMSAAAGVMGALGSSLAGQRSLCANGTSGVQAGAGALALSVSCHAPGAPGDALYTTGLSAGGVATLAPLPPGTLIGGADSGIGAGGAGGMPPDEIVCVLFALPFDPYVGRAGRALVRLEFVDTRTGAVLPVANLSAPLLIDVATPWLTSSGGGADGVVDASAAPVTLQFWDAAAQAYSTAGVTSMPNPAPRGAAFSWRPGFTAASYADIGLAWQMDTGADNSNASASAFSGCRELVLNCSDSWERSLAVSFDPEEWVGDPVLACGADDAGPLRVFVGHACPLWPRAAATAAANSSRYGADVLARVASVACTWDVRAQAFTGLGCVASAVTRAATLHATDFGAGPAPRLRVATPADAAAPSLATLRALRALALVLAALFGGTHALAALLNLRDQADLRRALANSRSALMGAQRTRRRGGDCAAGASLPDLYVWRLTQAPLDGAVAAVAGPAVEFAALVGVPFARLTLAIPEHLFGGLPPRHATGRASGISGAALRRHHATLMHAATYGVRAAAPAAAAHKAVAEAEAEAAEDVEAQAARCAADGWREREGAPAWPESPRWKGKLRRFMQPAATLSCSEGAPPRSPSPRRGALLRGPLPLLPPPLLASAPGSGADVCPICLEGGRGDALLAATCGHWLHTDCARAAADRSGHWQCPLCCVSAHELRPAGWAPAPWEPHEPPASKQLALQHAAVNGGGAHVRNGGARRARSAERPRRRGAPPPPPLGKRAALSASPPRRRPAGADAATTAAHAHAHGHNHRAAADGTHRTHRPSRRQARADLEALPEAPDLLQLSSTALVHAYQATWGLLSNADLAAQQLRYIGVLTACGLDPRGAVFLRLFATYKELLMGHLFGTGAWMRRTLLLRAVLLHAGGGVWEPCDALAVVLRAHTHAAAAAPAGAAHAAGAQLLRDRAQSCFSAAALSGAVESSPEGAADTFYDQRRRGAGAAARIPRADISFSTAAAHAEEEEESEGDDDDDDVDADADDPLHFRAAAIRRSVPPALRAAFPGDAAAARRCWATALVVAYLSAQDFAWLADDWAGGAAPPPRSLADLGASWLADALGGGGGTDDAALDALLCAAAAQLCAWESSHDALVTRSRAAHLQARFYALSQAQRCACSLVNSLVARCATLSMFVSLFSVGTRRWMSALTLGATLLSLLLVQTWLFWSKAAVCCGDARALLGCARDSAGVQCRGYAGLCADLASTFEPFALAALAPLPRTGGVDPRRAVALPACTAFPADGSGRDTFLAGLVSAAAALPVTSLVSRLLALSTVTDAAQAHGAVRLLAWPLRLRLALGAPRWRLDALPPRAAALRARLGRWWATTWDADALLLLMRALTRAPLPPPPRAAQHAAAPDAAAAAALDALQARARHAAFALLALLWALFSWLVIVYGRLVYTLLGPAAEAQFATAWAAGVGVGRAQELQDFLTTAAQLLLVATVLDALWLLPNSRWLETQVDYASVQMASLGAMGAAAAGGGGGVLAAHRRRVWTYLRHWKAVH